MVAAWADSFLLHVTDEENEMLNPDSIEKCHHNVHQRDCQVAPPRDSADVHQLCPAEEAVKYKMVRVSVESVNFFLTESECACNIQVLSTFSLLRISGKTSY